MAGYCEAVGRIDVTPCPRSGQIVCINPEIAGLCPLRWRAGQEGTGGQREMLPDWTSEGKSQIISSWGCSFLDGVTGQTPGANQFIFLNLKNLLVCNAVLTLPGNWIAQI